jgi:hypothetical protein
VHNPRGPAHSCSRSATPFDAGVDVDTPSKGFSAPRRPPPRCGRELTMEGSKHTPFPHSSDVMNPRSLSPNDNLLTPIVTARRFLRRRLVTSILSSPRTHTRVRHESICSLAFPALNLRLGCLRISTLQFRTCRVSTVLRHKPPPISSRSVSSRLHLCLSWIRGLFFGLGTLSSNAFLARASIRVTH